DTYPTAEPRPLCCAAERLTRATAFQHGIERPRRRTRVHRHSALNDHRSPLNARETDDAQRSLVGAQGSGSPTETTGRSVSPLVCEDRTASPCSHFLRSQFPLCSSAPHLDGERSALAEAGDSRIATRLQGIQTV